MNISYGRFSEILNGTVDSMNVIVGGYHITVNRVTGDPDLQVMIVELADNGKEIVDYVTAENLVNFIAENTN